MFHNSLTAAGLAILTALVGLASSADAQKREVAVNQPVQILKLERLTDLGEGILEERAGPNASAARAPEEHSEGNGELESKRAERLMPIEDMVSFRAHLEFPSLPPGATVGESMVILEGSLPNGRKMMARKTVPGTPRLVELELASPAKGMEFKEFRVRIRSNGTSGSGGNLVWNHERTFRADEVKFVEQ